MAGYGEDYLGGQKEDNEAGLTNPTGTGTGYGTAQAAGSQGATGTHGLEGEPEIHRGAIAETGTYGSGAGTGIDDDPSEKKGEKKKIKDKVKDTLGSLLHKHPKESVPSTTGPQTDPYGTTGTQSIEDPGWWGKTETDNRPGHTGGTGTYGSGGGAAGTGVYGDVPDQRGTDRSKPGLMDKIKDVVSGQKPSQGTATGLGTVGDGTGYGSTDTHDERGGHHASRGTPTVFTTPEGGVAHAQGQLHEEPHHDKEKKEGVLTKIMDKLHLHSPKGGQTGPPAA